MVVLIMKTLIFFGSLVVALHCVSFTDVAKEEWTNFKLEHAKVYSGPKEDGLRYKIYLENRYMIAQHNHRFYINEVSFQLAPNRFSDMTLEEANRSFKGFNRSALMRDEDLSIRLKCISFIRPANVEVPSSVNWTAEGAVTPVKDQGQCGSCYAFSSTGSLEGQHFRKTGKLVSLSEQNLVDCSRSYGDQGCNGGLMTYCFDYIKYNKGIDTEVSYPYEAYAEHCRFKKENVGATDTGYVCISKGDEQALMEAVATIGPISVAIDADHNSFMHYSKGVYYEPACSQNDLDHAVLVVGYGTDESSKKDYWLVKNSWGEDWGDHGYIKMSRNRNNNCGIATFALYPLV